MGATVYPCPGQGPPPQDSRTDWEKEVPKGTPRKKGSVEEVPPPQSGSSFRAVEVATFLLWSPFPLPLSVGEDTSWCGGLMQ